MLLLTRAWLYKTWIALLYREHVERAQESGAKIVTTFMNLCERYSWLQAAFAFWGMGLGVYLIFRQNTFLVTEGLMAFAALFLLW
jgi:hypothetical protein